MMGGGVFSFVFGLALLAAVIWAIVNIAQSGVSPGAKTLWILLVLVLPLFGFLIWLTVGPRARRASGGGEGPAG
jgi:drug/metabolite transporter (DMT)-like permease